MKRKKDRNRETETKIPPMATTVWVDLVRDTIENDNTKCFFNDRLEPPVCDDGQCYQPEKERKKERNNKLLHHIYLYLNQIWDGPDIRSQQILTTCGRGPPPPPILSTGGSMHLKLITDGNVQSIGFYADIYYINTN